MAKASVANKKWPDEPYKGLTFYSTEDVALYAGRDDDTDRMTSMIGNGATRIVLLHGMTGCGKSSFLRAGLIPALEEELSSYEFLRDEKDEPYFIRSTDDPTASVARKVFQSSQRKRLGIILEETEADFVKAVAKDPELLVKVLENIANNSRRTLVLVIDQAEEVVTLNPDRNGDQARAQFLDFLYYISRSKHDLKVLVTLRTEYHGQFYAQLRYGTDVSRVDDYFLAEFSKAQIVEAILRPASVEDIHGYGRPGDHYKFKYEEGLPEKIADALLCSDVSGGVLPIMQIVCRRLYKEVKHQIGDQGLAPIEITEKGYMTLGGVSGQVDAYLENELLDALGANSARDEFDSLEWVSEIEPAETAAWRKVLMKLVKPQVNGTVTTDVCPVADLKKRAEEIGSRANAGEVLKYLAEEKRRILRPVDVTQVQTKMTIPCYSMGHDILASALQAWNVQREVQLRIDSNLGAKRRKYLTLRIVIAAGIVLIAVFFFIRRTIDLGFLSLLLVCVLSIFRPYFQKGSTRLAERLRKAFARLLGKRVK